METYSNRFTVNKIRLTGGPVCVRNPLKRKSTDL